MFRFIVPVFLLFAGTSFGKILKDVHVKLVSESFDQTYECGRRRGLLRCLESDVKEMAEDFAKKRGGFYIAHEVLKAPEGFVEGDYRQDVNPLTILVTYLKENSAP